MGAAPAQDGVLLVMGVRALPGAPADTALLASQLLVAELRKQTSRTLVVQRELEATMGVDIARRSAGEDTSEKSKDTAMALNAQEVITGTLRVVGAGRLELTLQRVDAGTAAMLGSARRPLAVGDEDALLALMPALTAEVMGLPPPRRAATPTQEMEERSSTPRRVARVAGVGVGALATMLAGVLLGGGMAALTGVLVTVVYEQRMQEGRASGVLTVPAQWAVSAAAWGGAVAVVLSLPMALLGVGGVLAAGWLL